LGFISGGVDGLRGGTTDDVVGGEF